MPAPAFNDRVEKKFQLGIEEKEVAALWRDLSTVLHPYGLEPVQEITSVGSVYYDNKDCDLLRFSLLGHLMLFRTRAYEMYGQVPQPIGEYWIELKTAQGTRRRKRRFPLAKGALQDFLDGREMVQSVADRGREAGVADIGELYSASQETVLTMGLKPLLLVRCKRIAFQSDTSRLSIDWDVEYYHAQASLYEASSWKYLAEPSVGRSGKVILEMKCLTDEGVPAWFSELQQRYPVWAREYLKPVEGMGCLFKGPLRHHKEVNYFIPLINAYMENSLLG
jgi:SPX domain protein involved in polyphosphate accumulation